MKYTFYALAAFSVVISTINVILGKNDAAIWFIILSNTFLIAASEFNGNHYAD